MLHRELLVGGHFFGGVCDQGVAKGPVYAPYDGHVVGTCAEGTWQEMDAAIDAADSAFATWKASSRRDRQTLLRTIARLVRERAQELVDLLTDEVGKPVTWSWGEVKRLAVTFDLAADYLSSPSGEVLPTDFDERGTGYRCLVERFPVGPVLAVTPYNWPYNLAAHKIAPALAAGNTVVFKPSPLSPLSSLTLARLIHEAGCPEGVLNAVVCNGPTTQKAVTDPRIKMVSFTGSDTVGWMIKGLVPEKRVALELGGDASAIVMADADLDWTVSRLVAGGYGYAGQVCISIQHVLVEQSVYGDVKERLIEATRDCPTGDPRNAETVCGPLIGAAAADKVQEWTQEALDRGAKGLVIGERVGNVVGPTLLEDVSPDSRLGGCEVFGPVLTLQAFGKPSQAYERVNQSSYGIHCGVFSHDMRVSEEAFRSLEVGGVIVNDYPTLRFDNMPYGGVKRSGTGREGIASAFAEMSEPRVLLARCR